MTLGALIFSLLESDTKAEDHQFAGREIVGNSHPRLARTFHSFFLSVMGLTTEMDHEPTTFPSRLFVALKAPPSPEASFPSPRLAAMRLRARTAR